MRKQIFGEILNFEHLLKDADGSKSQCRNGLNVVQHPKKYRDSLQVNATDFNHEINSLERNTNKLFGKLENSA